ncbi:MAG: hypothetical protein K1X71_00005 [Pirellulales bacterium]|nr:hypothetical protein [Pirellulales bacterium]
MRSKIRWIGFAQEIPWYVAILLGWMLVTMCSVGASLALPELPKVIQVSVFVVPQLLFGAILYWISRSAQKRRTAALKLFAEQCGMKFIPRLDDRKLFPSQELPVMAKRYLSRPLRNLLIGDLAGVEVWLFDMSAGRDRRVRDQTLAYFPTPMQNLRDFPTGLVVAHVPSAYEPVLRSLGKISLESKQGRLILYRWHHLVRPESYPEFLTVVGRAQAQLAECLVEDAKQTV